MRPAVVGDVDRGAGGDDLVDAVQHVIAELDVGGGELGFEVAHGARPNNCRGHGGVTQDERKRELDQGEAGILGKLGESIGGVELALVGGVAQVEASRGRAAELGPWTSVSLR